MAGTKHAQKHIRKGSHKRDNDSVLRMKEDDIIHLLSELVGINSVNPTLSNGPGEEKISAFVAQYLRDLGLSLEKQALGSKRSNVVAIIPGKDHTSSLLLNAHLDTVGVEDMDDPFKLRREGDRLYGRGAYDMKGSIAIMLLLAKYFSHRKPPLDILLTFVADEEDKSLGMEYLVHKWLANLPTRPIGGVFLEPTEQNIGACHKGFVWYEIEVTGKGAHGSRPAEGTDAILPLKDALTELIKIESELSRVDKDPLLGHGSLHPGVIEGGTAISVIPSRSRLLWERRTLPGETHEDLNLELERVIEAVRRAPGRHKVTGREIFARPPYEVSDQAGIVKWLKKVSPQSKLVGLSFWADAALAGLAGMPSVLFGPIGHGAHSADEWVSLRSLVRVYGILRALVATLSPS
jgi:acetylornithine deacetylase